MGFAVVLIRSGTNLSSETCQFSTKILPKKIQKLAKTWFRNWTKIRLRKHSKIKLGNQDWKCETIRNYTCEPISGSKNEPIFVSENETEIASEIKPKLVPKLKPKWFRAGFFSKSWPRKPERTKIIFRFPTTSGNAPPTAHEAIHNPNKQVGSDEPANTARSKLSCHVVWSSKRESISVQSCLKLSLRGGRNHWARKYERHWNLGVKLSIPNGTYAHNARHQVRPRFCLAWWEKNDRRFNCVFTLSSTPYTQHSTLYTLHFTLYFLQSTLHECRFYPLFSSLYALPFILYSLLSTFYSLLFTLYRLLFILYPLLSTLHSLFSTLYSLLSDNNSLFFAL